MSIYVSIVTLEDPDIVSTVSTAINNATHKDSLRIGVAAAVGDEFFQRYVSGLSRYPQVVAKKFDTADAKGIGKGRTLSRFAYSGEDYILQVDSHTHFQSGWDEIVLGMYDKALQETGNDKTVLTAYLGPHEVNGGRVVIKDDNPRYCLYSNKTFDPLVRVQAWFSKPLSIFPNQEDIPDKEIIPAIKVGANFMFGNKNFAEFSGISEKAIFWEEELIQTVNLLEAGFSLAFPNMRLPLTHRYNQTDDLGGRQSVVNLFFGEFELSHSITTRNMYDFIQENGDACARYEKYSKYDIITGIVRPFHIPQTFEY